MKNKTVLVTGIGGNAGQGILRNIIALNKDIRLIGTNTESISGGNYLCDVVYKVPFSSDPTYIVEMIDICKKENVDLIIPSTDYEVFYLSLHKNRLPTLASLSADVADIFLNKYKTSVFFKAAQIPFAETFLPSKYNDEFDQIIVKPAEGRGSRGLHINPKNPKEFSSEYIVQKLYQGKEITTAFYVTKKGKLHGHITFERSLVAGATHRCEVTTEYEKEIEDIITKILKNFTIRGSCNIQSIVSDDGSITPFEVNGRISGTNSIRSQFGFEDVKYTIEEYLYNKVPTIPKITKGACVRIYLDIIYPDISLNEIKTNKDTHYIY